MCTYRYTWRTSIHIWMSSPGHWARRGRRAPATHVGNFGAFSKISSSDSSYSDPNSHCVRANEFGWFSQYSMHHSAPDRPLSEAHAKWVAKVAKSYQSFWPGYLGYSWLMRPDVPTSYVEMASLQGNMLLFQEHLESNCLRMRPFNVWQLLNSVSISCLWTMEDTTEKFFALKCFEHQPSQYAIQAQTLCVKYLAIYNWCSENQEERSHCHHRTSPKYSVWQFGASAYRTIPYHITRECNIPFHSIMLY